MLLSVTRVQHSEAYIPKTLDGLEVGSIISPSHCVLNESLRNHPEAQPALKKVANQLNKRTFRSAPPPLALKSSTLSLGAPNEI